MTATPIVARDGDRHLSPTAYRALAALAGAIGLAAGYVTIRLFALAIQQGESDSAARELLGLAAVLFVAAELAACFIAGLVPVQRLRALRWQLTACAVVLLAFEAVSLYGARVTLAQAAEARAGAAEGRAHQLRASLDAQRRSAAALLEAGQRSSQSALASSRADGAQSLRDAVALQASTARLAAELAELEAARTPTASAVFGESGVIALAVVQSLLISSIGLVFLGAAGAMVRAARDAQVSAAPLHPSAPIATPPLPAAAVTATPRRALVAVEQFQVTPRGAIAAVPGWGRSALAAGAGLMTLATVPAHAVQMPMQPPAAATPARPTVSTSLHPDTATAASQARRAATARAPSVRRDTGVGEGDNARFLRVRAGIAAGHIKPSIRAIYAAEGASQAVAKRYLVALEQAGVIERAGRGYALVLNQLG